MARCFRQRDVVRALLREDRHGRCLEPELTVAIRALAVELDERCVRKLRALPSNKQRHAAACLEVIDFAGIANASGFVSAAVDKGTLFERAPEPPEKPVAPPAPPVQKPVQQPKAWAAPAPAPEPPIIQKAPGPAWGAVGRAPGADRAPPPEPPPARAPPAMAPPPARAAPGPPAPVGPPGAGRPAPVGAPGAPPAPARAPGAAWGAVGPPPPPRRPEPDPRIAPPAWGAPEPPPAWGSNGPPPPPPQQSKAPGFDRAIGGGNAFASAWEPGRLVQTPRSPPRDLAPPGLPRSPISPPLQPRASPMSSPLGAPPPGLHGDDYIPPNLVDVPRPSDAIPEGLVDVQRRSNCALDAIVAVLCRCPTFVRAAGRPSQGDSRALRALDASLQAAERGANSDAAVDALREALASSGDDTVIRAELKTRGAHLDVAEVLGEVVNVARPSAQQALRTRGRVSQQACRRCGHFNDDFVDDVELNELARSAPAAALVHAAETNGSLERVYLEAHAHAPKTCDKCRAPQACDVDVLLEQSARALVLSVGWPSSNVSSDDVLALLAFVGRSGARDCGRAGAIWPDRVFAAAGNNARPLDLLAVVVFQNAHYTAFVRSPDGADAWTHHDRQARIHVGAWTDVVVRDGKWICMRRYLLVYDGVPRTRRPSSTISDSRLVYGAL